MPAHTVAPFVPGASHTFTEFTIAAGTAGHARTLTFNAALSATTMHIAGPFLGVLMGNLTATTLTFDCIPARRGGFRSNSTTQRNISVASGTVEADYLSLQGIAATGGATFKAGRHSIDLGNNSGWSFTSTVTHKVTHTEAGETLDNSRTPTSADVYLFKDIGGGLIELVDSGASDGSGEYTLDSYDDDATHFVVARKTGSPNRFDVTDFDIQPVVV
jgi:hypothetical protein